LDLAPGEAVLYRDLDQVGTEDVVACTVKILDR
jgi:hypothetical protein